MRISSLVVVKCNNEILLCKRSLEQINLAGYWSVPGGNVEPGEEPIFAAYREFHEETNLTLKNPVKLLGFFELKNDLGLVKYKNYVFLYEVDNFIYPQLDYAKDGKEHTRCGYFKLDDLPHPMNENFKNFLTQNL